MTTKSPTRLRKEEFISLLAIGNLSPINAGPLEIPAEHQTRLIELGFIVDLLGRLRVTSLGSALLSTREQRSHQQIKNRRAPRKST